MLGCEEGDVRETVEQTAQGSVSAEQLFGWQQMSEVTILEFGSYLGKS